MINETKIISFHNFTSYLPHIPECLLILGSELENGDRKIYGADLKRQLICSGCRFCKIDSVMERKSSWRDKYRVFHRRESNQFSL
jgi:hypothetical protein